MIMNNGSISSLKHYVLCLILAFGVAGCGGESDAPSAAEKALNELQAKYDELSQKGLSDPVQWAAEDLENIGDWEYKVEGCHSTVLRSLRLR